jgi:hypothetical protein
MSSNILNAIKNISDLKNNNLSNYFESYSTKIETTRQQIGYYLKDAISGTSKSSKEKKPKTRYKETFSYLGNKNSPPDFIIKDGDAFVIKKNQTVKSGLILGNSPPKDCLTWNDPWILKNCRKVDGGQWNKKDIFYVTCMIEKDKIKYLYFIQGQCLVADKEVYEKTILGLKKTIDSYLKSEGLEKPLTSGLGKINKLDPLGVTTLRIRDVWKIQNPIKIFSDIYEYNRKQEFTMIAIMLRNKFNSFPKKDIQKLLSDKLIEVKDEKIKNPNDPSEMIDAKLIIRSW